MFFYSVIQDKFDKYQDIFIHVQKFTEDEFILLVKENSYDDLINKYGFKTLKVECQIYSEDL